MNRVPRRTVLLGAVAATTLHTAPAAWAETTPTGTDVPLGVIPGELGKADLLSGTAATSGAGTTPARAMVLPTGIAPTPQVLDVTTGRVLIAGDTIPGFDRLEASATLEDSSLVLLTASGRLLHHVAGSSQVRCYTHSRDAAGSSSVFGQMSPTTAVGQARATTAHHPGLYAGDAQGNLNRVDLRRDGATVPDPFIRFGTPFGTRPIRSLLYFDGWLYIAAGSSTDGGVWRIREESLNRHAGRRTLNETHFQKIVVAYPADLATPADAVRFYQMVLTDNDQTLAVRVTGDKWTRTRLSDLSADGRFSFPQQIQAQPDGRLLGRVNHYGTYYLVEVSTRPGATAWTDWRVIARLGNGNVGIGAGQGTVMLDGAEHLLAISGDAIGVVPLQAATSLPESIPDTPHPVLGPAVRGARTQMRQVVALARSGSAPTRVIAAPFWVNDPRLLVVDAPSYSGAPTTRLISQFGTSNEAPSSSTQSESLLDDGAGQLIIGTYTAAAMRHVNPSGPVSASAALAGGPTVSTVGPYAAMQARPQGGSLIQPGLSVFGSLSKYNSGVGGAVTLVRTSNSPSVSRVPALRVHSGDEWLPPLHNATATEVVRVGGTGPDGSNTFLAVLVGTSTRLEQASGARASGDAVIQVMPLRYTAATGYTLGSPRTVPLPEGVEAVWDIAWSGARGTSRLFALVQYEDRVLNADMGSGIRPTTDLICLLELDPVTFAPMSTARSQAGGTGLPVWTTRRDYFRDNGQLLVGPAGRIYARTNVLLHRIDLPASGRASWAGWLGHHANPKIYGSFFGCSIDGGDLFYADEQSEVRMRRL